MSVPGGHLITVIDRELNARGLTVATLAELITERFPDGDQPDTWARRILHWRRGSDAHVHHADQVLTALGLHLQDLTNSLTTTTENPRRAGGKPAGVYGLLTDTQLRALHRAHLNGTSIHALGRHIHDRVGYASPKSAAMAISNGFMRLGLERRDRITATRLASTTHGLAPRGAVDPTHKRMMRVKRGEIMDRPLCAAVRKNSPRRGEPCRLRAMAGSEFCSAHDPNRARERDAHLTRMRSINRHGHPE